MIKIPSLFITIPTNPTRIPFPFPATPPAKVGTDRKLMRCRSSPCHLCSKKNQFDTNPRTQPGFHFLFRPRLVPIGSSCNSGHRHAILITRKRSESCRSKSWKVAESPLQFAVISPVSGDATTWVLFPTIFSVLSDQPQPSGELICRWSAVEWFTALGEINLIFVNESLNKNE